MDICKDELRMLLERKQTTMNQMTSTVEECCLDYFLGVFVLSLLKVFSTVVPN